MKENINKIMRWYLRQRMGRILEFIEQPHKVQQQVLQQLITASKHTKWGKQFGYQYIKDGTTYAKQVPVFDYESLKPYIQRMMYGEKDVLWGGQVKWFAKSSGTTSDKSKYIPLTRQNLVTNHVRGNWDTTTILYRNDPNARNFADKNLLMVGSLETFEPYPKTTIGDVSAILTYNMPWIGRPFVAPDLKTALMSDWEEKIERIAQLTKGATDINMIAGVPTWTIVLFRKLLELTGKDNILEVWPNLKNYAHGGVGFAPYKEQFKQFIPNKNFTYIEIYNASEGFFSIQMNPDDEDMLLLLNNGTYYEFLPMEEWNKEHPVAIPLSEVEVGKNYAMVVSTNAGLWRYKVGDTVMFTSIYPYKIKITGRTKQFVNAFGEEVMVENTDKAMAITCKQLEAIMLEYTVAPVYFSERGKGGHHWLIEFDKPPKDIDYFAKQLDGNLQKINSDYEAKRFKNLALNELQITVLPKGTFYDWMRSRGKFGVQNKVPRLANHRRYLEDILRLRNGQKIR